MWPPMDLTPCSLMSTGCIVGLDHGVGHFRPLRIIGTTPNSSALNGLGASTWDRSRWGGRRNDQGHPLYNRGNRQQQRIHPPTREGSPWDMLHRLSPSTTSVQVNSTRRYVNSFTSALTSGLTSWNSSCPKPR